MPPKFFLITEEIEKNSKLNGTRAEYFSWFVGKYHFISGSTVKSNTYMLFCHFPRSSWPTWKLHHPFIGGKATLVDLSCFNRPKKHFFSTSALVNNVLYSRATVGHSSSWLNQRKSHRPSLFISEFSTVFFKTLCSIKLQSFSRLPFQFNPISISLFQDFVFYCFFIFTLIICFSFLC